MASFLWTAAGSGGSNRQTTKRPRSSPRTRVKRLIGKFLGREKRRRLCRLARGVEREAFVSPQREWLFIKPAFASVHAMRLMSACEKALSEVRRGSSLAQFHEDIREHLQLWWWVLWGIWGTHGAIWSFLGQRYEGLTSWTRKIELLHAEYCMVDSIICFFQIHVPDSTKIRMLLCISICTLLVYWNVAWPLRTSIAEFQSYICIFTVPQTHTSSHMEAMADEITRVHFLANIGTIDVLDIASLNTVQWTGNIKICNLCLSDIYMSGKYLLPFKKDHTTYVCISWQIFTLRITFKSPFSGKLVTSVNIISPPKCNVMHEQTS